MKNDVSDTSKKTVVVAGATGRAGRCIIKELLHRGYRVRALLVPSFDPPDPAELIRKYWEPTEGIRLWVPPGVQKGAQPASPSPGAFDPQTLRK